LLVAGIILIAINLRPAIASVGPLVGIIRIDTGLSNTLLGLLTTLPLMAFGIISLMTPLFTRRFGVEGTILGALILLTSGILLRVVESEAALFGGTILLGIAIAFGNVLLPTIVKRDFPNKSGIMTSLYSSVMGMGAALGAGISVPLAETLNLGWRGSLGSWSILSTIALLVWLPQLRSRIIPYNNRGFFISLKKLGRSAIAWHVAMFMGLQSLAFYVVLAWLPEILISRGIGTVHAGWLLSLSQGTGVLGTFLIPAFSEKINRTNVLIWILVILEIISLAGLMLPGGLLPGLWASFIGFSLGGSFGLALLFIVLKTANSESATKLSGLAQSIGYLLAATGPTLFGALFDITGNWFIPLLMLSAVAVFKLYFGLKAEKNRV